MLTDNKNFLSPLGFQLIIDGPEFANVNFFCISANLPSISLPEAAANYKKWGQAFPGDRIQFDPLNVQFKVDENCQNYLEIWNWIKNSVGRAAPQFRDVTLHVLSSKNNLLKKIRYYSAFPTSLDGIEFNVQESDIEYVTCACSLRYTNFEFIT